MVDSGASGPRSCAQFFALGLTAPLFLAACLFAAGIVAAHFLYLPPGHLLLATLALGCLSGIGGIWAPRIAWVPLGILWLLLGAWSAEMEPQPAPTPQLATFSDGLLRTVEGTIRRAGPVRAAQQEISGQTEPEPPTQSFDLNVTAIEKVDDEVDELAPTSGAVRLTARWRHSLPQRIPCGTRVRVVARLLPPLVYHDPGVWSRADYLLDQGITSTATVDVERIELVGSSSRLPIACRLNEFQQASSTRLLSLPAEMAWLPASLRLSHEDAVMLSAMVTGDRTFLSHSLRMGFERTGSFHMLVVSGLHLAIVAGCILWLARRFRFPRIPATLLTILGSLGYALFTGFATPVQRSFWMVTLYLVARLFFRQRSVLNTMGFAALCLMVASPRAVFDSSLVMTLLAVVAIGGVAAPLLHATLSPYVSACRELKRVGLDIKLAPPIAQFRLTVRMVASALQRAAGRFLAWRVFPGGLRLVLRVCEAALVSVVIELAMMLPMAVWFHRVTVFALPVNLLILPMLVLLLPAALFSLMTSFVSPALAAIPAALVAALLHLGVGMVHMFGAWNWGDLRIASPTAVQVAGFWCLLAAAIFLMHTPKQWTRLTSCGALLMAATVSVMPRAMERDSHAMEVEAIDVGQGDSLLVITPEGKTLLVDAGGLGGNPAQPAPEFDIGEEVVSAALWSRGIRHLDVVALTHGHSDHMGGMPAILENFRPDELWVGNNPAVPTYNALLVEAGHLGIHVRSMRAGDRAGLGSAAINVLAPVAGYTVAAQPANNDSLVLRVAYGNTSALLEGDAEAPIERAMLNEPGLASTLLKVGHHGSTTSTTPEFLARVSPKWAVISCGIRNRYGHPRQEVLQELQDARVLALSTDINGAVCFRLDGESTRRDVSCGREPSP